MSSRVAVDISGIPSDFHTLKSQIHTIRLPFDPSNHTIRPLRLLGVQWLFTKMIARQNDCFVLFVWGSVLAKMIVRQNDRQARM